mmetsp:Transcript_88273/g.189494  ORF Transcript_88273/g.189494 Transcript_88273/m.189494 type:complete len:219 (-) Transcript_88273:2678-3334(-)
MPSGHLRTSCSSVTRSWRSVWKREMVRSRCFSTARSCLHSSATSAICSFFCSTTTSICFCTSSWSSNCASKSRSWALSCAIISSLGCKERVTSCNRKSKTCLNFFKVFAFTLCAPISNSLSLSVASRSRRSAFRLATSRCMASASAFSLFTTMLASSCSFEILSCSFSIMSRPRIKVSWSFFNLYSTWRWASNSAWFLRFSSASSKSCSMPSWSSMVS